MLRQPLDSVTNRIGLRVPARQSRRRTPRRRRQHRHQQTRQRVLAQDFHPRSAGCSAADQEGPGANRSLARCAGWPRSEKTSPWSPWPISWPASHGLCCPAEKTTDQTATSSQHDSAEKTPTAWKRGRAPTLPHYGDGLKFTRRGPHRNSKDERTVTTAWLETCWTC